MPSHCCWWGNVWITSFCSLYTMAQVILHPLLMTRESLPRTLQTALSDAHGASQGASFEPRSGMNPPKAIGVLSSSSHKMPLPVFSCDALGPALSFLPFQDVHIWVQAHSVFSKCNKSESLNSWQFGIMKESWNPADGADLRVFKF
jgi:hypothetical protein